MAESEKGMGARIGCRSAPVPFGPTNMAAAVAENMQLFFVRDKSTNKGIKRLVIKKISQTKTWRWNNSDNEGKSSLFRKFVDMAPVVALFRSPTAPPAQDEYHKVRNRFRCKYTSTQIKELSSIAKWLLTYTLTYNP